MAVGQRTPLTSIYGCVITTVDPSQGLVEFVLKTGDRPRKASIYNTPAAFRWPIVGEHWFVRQENDNWYLQGVYPSTKATTDWHALNPGDMMLNTPTGIIQVIGGDSDFTLAQRTGTAHFTGVSGTTGVITLEHSLGHVPKAVLCMPHGWSGYMSSTGVILTSSLVSLSVTGALAFNPSVTYSFFFFVSL